MVESRHLGAFERISNLEATCARLNTDLEKLLDIVAGIEAKMVNGLAKAAKTAKPVKLHWHVRPSWSRIWAELRASFRLHPLAVCRHETRDDVILSLQAEVKDLRSKVYSKKVVRYAFEIEDLGVQFLPENGCAARVLHARMRPVLVPIECCEASKDEPTFAANLSADPVLFMSRKPEWTEAYLRDRVAALGADIGRTLAIHTMDKEGW